jgi:EAL domain-containing protein (putative c-di-GMP-specific phosphodiesterase class I)
VLKIDKEFTKFIVNNKFNENIVKTICSLGNSLNLDLICEGVETQEQFRILTGMGGKLFQGYLFAKPLPVEEFEKQFLSTT